MLSLLTKLLCKTLYFSWTQNDTLWHIQILLLSAHPLKAANTLRLFYPLKSLPPASSALSCPALRPAGLYLETALTWWQWTPPYCRSPGWSPCSWGSPSPVLSPGCGSCMLQLRPHCRRCCLWLWYSAFAFCHTTCKNTLRANVTMPGFLQWFSQQLQTIKAKKSNSGLIVWMSKTSHWCKSGVHTTTRLGRIVRGFY